MKREIVNHVPALFDPIWWNDRFSGWEKPISNRQMDLSLWILTEECWTRCPTLFVEPSRDGQYDNKRERERGEERHIDKGEFDSSVWLTSPCVWWAPPEVVVVTVFIRNWIGKFQIVTTWAMNTFLCCLLFDWRSLSYRSCLFQRPE